MLNISVLQNTIEYLNRLFSSAEQRHKVNIRPKTREKCPKCKGQFIEIPGLGFFCPKCKTIPRRYYLDFYYAGRRVRIFSDRNGSVLSSYEQALRLASRISYEIENRTFDPTKYIARDFKEFLFENYIQKWLAFSETKLKPSSFKDRKRIIKSLLIPFFKGKDIREIKAAHIQDFYLSLQERKISKKTIWNILAELKAFLNFAKKREDIERVPAFPEVKYEEKPIVWLNQEQQKRILEAIPEEHKPIFTFLFTYGCRPGEARALMWDAVDFENEIIYIKRTFSNRKLVNIPKEGKWKVLPMLPHIKEVLLKLAEKKKSMFVFSWRYGYYGERALPKIWKEACEKVGITGVSLYAGVRHSFAMQRLREGFSYEEIGACLGHSDVRTTRKYGRLMAQNLTRVFSRSAKIISLEEYRQSKGKISATSEKSSTSETADNRP